MFPVLNLLPGLLWRKKFNPEGSAFPDVPGFSALLLISRNSLDHLNRLLLDLGGIKSQMEDKSSANYCPGKTSKIDPRGSQFGAYHSCDARFIYTLHAHGVEAVYGGKPDCRSSL